MKLTSFLLRGYLPTLTYADSSIYELGPVLIGTDSAFDDGESYNTKLGLFDLYGYIPTLTYADSSIYELGPTLLTYDGFDSALGGTPIISQDSDGVIVASSFTPIVMFF